MKREFEEQQFEKALDLEDKSIAKYFREIVDFLDLPGEEEAITDRLIKGNNKEAMQLSYSKGNLLPPEIRKISFDNNLEMFLGSESSENSETSDNFYQVSTSKIEYGYLLEKFNQLSTRWAMQYSLNKYKRLNNNYLAIICQISKISNRLYDLVVIAIEKKNLRNCLCKRVLREINILINMISKIEDNRFNKLNYCSDIEELKIARSSVIDILFKEIS